MCGLRFFFTGATIILILACPLHRYCPLMGISCTGMWMFFSSMPTYLQKYGSSNHWGESKNSSIPEVSFYEGRCFGGSLRNYDSIGLLPIPWWFLVITVLRTFWPESASTLCSTVIDEHIFSGYVQSLFFLIHLYLLTLLYAVITNPNV